MPDRELPPVFGVETELNGVRRRRYPLGHQGRFLRLGDLRLSDARGIANRVANAALPPSATRRLRDQVRDGILEFLRENGRHAFQERLLDGALAVPVMGTGKVPMEVVVELDLGDMDLASHLKALGVELTPVGMLGHHAVEAEHEDISGTANTTTSDRSFSATGDVLLPFGFLPGGALSAILGGRLTGGSTVSYLQATDTVAAVKRAPRYEHKRVYFDFAGASLKTEVRPARYRASAAPGAVRSGFNKILGKPSPSAIFGYDGLLTDPAVRTGRLALTARAAFPDEVCPKKVDGDPPGVFRSPPRRLSDSRQLGLSIAAVNRLINEAGRLAAEAERLAGNADGPTREAERLIREAVRLAGEADGPTREADRLTRKADRLTREAENAQRRATESTEAAQDATQPAQDATQPPQPAQAAQAAAQAAQAAAQAAQAAQAAARPAQDAAQTAQDAAQAAQDAAQDAQDAAQAAQDAAQAAQDAAETARAVARDAPQKVADVISHFLHMPEWVTGMREVTDAVHARLARNGVLDPKVKAGVEKALSPSQVKRLYGNITGPGATSAVIMDSKGKERAILIIKAQLRTAEALTIGELGLKEETQRFTNNWDGKAQGGSVTLDLPNANVSHQFGSPEASLGLYSSLGGGVGASFSLASERTHRANTESGDIRGLVNWDESVLFDSRWGLTVEIVTPDAEEGNVPTVQGDIAIGFRIPRMSRDRLELMLDQAVGLHLREDLPVDDWPDNDKQTIPRYPPASIAANKGIHFAAVTHLAGAEKVLPRVLGMIQHELGVRLTPFERAYLRSQLNSRFTLEALKGHANELFQPGGTRMELFVPSEPNRPGVDVITVQVSATHDKQPIALGRVKRATQEGMPSAFSGNSGSDSITAGYGGSFGGSGFLGLGRWRAKGPRTVGGAFRIFGSRSRQSELNVGQSGFTLQANLYEGPARIWTYRTEYDIQVWKRHETSYRSGPSLWIYRGLKKAATKTYRGVKQLVTGGAEDQAPIAPPMAAATEATATKAGSSIQAIKSQASAAAVTLPDVAEDTLVGQVEFLLLEELAPAAPVDQATLDNVGKVEVKYFDPPPLAERRKLLTEVKLPAIEGKHDALNQDDLVMEVLGGDQIASVIKDLLTSLGMKDTSVRDLPWTIAAAEYLAASMVRGPSVIMNTIVQDGWFADRHAVVTVEGFPVDTREEPEAVDIFEMHVAEGDGFVESSDTKSWSAGIFLGLPYFQVGSVGARFNLQGSYGHIFGRSTTSTANLTTTSGRLTQGKRPYLPRTATMKWRIHVTTRRKNLITGRKSPLTLGGMNYAGAVVTVQDGISYLRRKEAAVSPLQGAPTPPPPNKIAHIGRQPAPTAKATAHATAGAPRVRRSRNVRATTREDDPRMVPYAPLLPASAMTDRLYTIPEETKVLNDPAAKVEPAPPRPKPDPGVTGEGNPLLEIVRKLLADEAPELLERHWTAKGIDGTPVSPRPVRLQNLLSDTAVYSARVRQVPARLQNVVNQTSATTMWDLFTSSGVILTTIMSGPLGNYRVQVRLQAQRDAHNLGLDYLETIENLNSVRYAFRLSQRKGPWAKLRGSSTGSAQPEGAASLAGGFLFTGGESGGPGRHVGVVRSGNVEPSLEYGRSTTMGGYASVVVAERDTLFIPGEADSFGNVVKISAQLVKTWLPSRLFNSVLFNLPRLASSRWQHANDQRRKVARRKVASRDLLFAERVVSPQALINAEDVPEGPPGDIAAVKEVHPTAPNAPPPHGALGVTPEQILDREVVTLGFDAEKLQILIDEVLAKLAHNELPLSGEKSHAVARLLVSGTRGRDALHYMLNYQMLTRQLDKMLGNGMKMPAIFREGGAITDNRGEVTVRVPHRPACAGVLRRLDGIRRLPVRRVPAEPRAGSRILDQARRWRRVQRRGPQPGRQPGIAGAADRRRQPRRPVLHEEDQVGVWGTADHAAGGRHEIPQPVASGRRGRDHHGDRGGEQPGRPAQAAGRQGHGRAPGAQRRRAWHDTREQHRARHVPPRRHTGRLWHLFPPPPQYRPASIQDLVHAASSLSFLDGAFAVQALAEDGKFLMGDGRRLSAAELAAQLRTRLSQLPPPPDPTLSAEQQPPPGPKQLERPDDPIPLITPYGAVIPPGQTIAPGQAVADEMERPVMTPDTSYRITRNASVLAIDLPAPGETAFGRGWRPGNWVVFFPRSSGRAPHVLATHDYADAMARARAELGWTAAVGARPDRVDPPTQDVHFGVQTTATALAQWQRGSAAAHHLAAAARELLPQTGPRRAALEAAFHDADVAMRPRT